jgi:competence protein ComEC
VALDVGQGDALALAFPDGWWLVDAGARSPRYDAGESVVRPFLRWAAVRRLRVLALTHDDGDHTGGAPAVLRSIGADTLLGPPPLPGVPGPLARFVARSLGRRTVLRFAARGDTLRRDVDVRVLWPPRAGGAGDTTAAVALAARSDNAAGLVIEIAIGETRALLMADADSLDESAIALDGRVALLKVGHHGSASSTGATFLARAAPREAWISAGAHNVYGHPSPGTLARLAQADVPVRRTDREGALWVELAPGGIRRVSWRTRDPLAIEPGRADPPACPAPAAAPRSP